MPRWQKSLLVRECHCNMLGFRLGPEKEEGREKQKEAEVKGSASRL